MILRISRNKTLCFSIIFIYLMSILAFPAKATTFRSSEYISRCYAQISAEAGGDMEISFSIYGLDTMEEIGASTIYLYESAGSGYRLVKTYRHTDENYRDMATQNTSNHFWEVTYPGIPGRSYYAEVNFFASDEFGEDTDQKTTDIITARH